MLSLEETSPKDLMEKLRSKSQRKSIILLQEARQKIEHQHSENTQNAVSVFDLQNVLKLGNVIRLEVTSGGWNLTLHGTTLDGENLLISVHLPDKEDAPLQIQNFGSIQSSFMNLLETLSDEEQITTQQFIRYLRKNAPATDENFRVALDSFVREHQELLQKLAH